MHHYMARVICNAESHHPKKALTGRIQGRREDLSSPLELLRGSVSLIDEAPVNSKDIWGGVRRRPDFDLVDAFESRGRNKHEFVCNLCGLNANLRDETAEATLRGLDRLGAFVYKRSPVSGVGPGQFIDTHSAVIYLPALVATL